MKPSLLILGVMTGNSLDAVDTVITRFSSDGDIRDLFHYSMPLSPHLAEQIRAVKEALRSQDGDVRAAERSLNSTNMLDAVHQSYLQTVALACRKSIESAQAAKVINASGAIDIVGFHGQTCAHKPPSIARLTGDEPYTIQMGDGQALANALEIPVAFDFRSDDLMNGGEGAPFAPMHHHNLALGTKSKGVFPIGFLNGGNTGNLSVITHQIGKSELAVLGWDTGPFNHFPDLLARREAHKLHDTNGEVGLQGTVNRSLLRILFNHSSGTQDGANFLTLSPPRSSDPQWYRELPEMLGTAPVDGAFLSLPDRMRTAEYFAAYVATLSCAFIPEDCEFPPFIGLCGGGWKNPVVTTHFKHLMRGSPGQVILEEHEKTYHRLLGRMARRPATVESTAAFGFDPSSMEARIFADAAARRVWGEPFTRPSMTGVSRPTLCGRIRFPYSRDPNGFAVGRYMSDAGILNEAVSKSDFSDPRFGRAIRGWREGAGPGL